MRKREKHIWVTKKELKSFIEAWAACCAVEELSDWQRKVLVSFKTFVLERESLVQFFVFENITKVCSQLGIAPPEYKVNDAYYSYWRKGEEARLATWKTFKSNQTHQALMANGFADMDSVSVRLTSAGDRVKELEARVEILEQLNIAMAEEYEARLAALEAKLSTGVAA